MFGRIKQAITAYVIKCMEIAVGNKCYELVSKIQFNMEDRLVNVNNGINMIQSDFEHFSRTCAEHEERIIDIRNRLDELYKVILQFENSNSANYQEVHDELGMIYSKLFLQTDCTETISKKLTSIVEMSELNSRNLKDGLEIIDKKLNGLFEHIDDTRLLLDGLFNISKNIENGNCILDEKINDLFERVSIIHIGIDNIFNRFNNCQSTINTVSNTYDLISEMRTSLAENNKNVQDGICIVDNKMNSLFSVFGLQDDYYEIENSGEDESSYIKMQKNEYEDETVDSKDIVGQYSWHEEYPYETFLLNKYGDVRKPLFDSFSDKVALDFGCGPGRMINRMNRIFKRVDGCDISLRLLEEAKRNNPDSFFYLTSGNDLGDAPQNAYDFVYCTISMQHIASYSIRSSIINNIFSALKKDGFMVLQMAYNPDYPYVLKKKKIVLNNNSIEIKGRQPMSNYFENHYEAPITNGGFDVGIGKNDIEPIKNDLKKIFSDVSIWFSNVSEYYENLVGEKHSDYWAEDWIYICAQK